MVDFSLGEWLGLNRSRTRSGKARKRRQVQTSRIETLEDRALLTANLPVAVDDAFTLDEDTPYIGASVLANDTDADGDTIDAAVIDVEPANGTLTLNGDGTFTYTPNANFSGTDSFTYFARDTANNETSATSATVTLTINALNDLPVVADASVSTDEDVDAAGTLVGLDAEGDTLEFAEGSVAATNGTVVINADGTYVFTPDADFSGTATFSYIANDGTGDSNEGTVTITVNAVNDAPVATPAGLNVNEDDVLNGSLAATDAEGDLLTFSVSSDPTSGTLIVNPDGTFTYTPNLDFSGTDSFSFIVNDGLLDSTPAVVTVVVDGVNDLPEADDLALTTDEDVAVTGTLTATDLDGDTLEFLAGTVAAANGTVTIEADGSFTYTPNQDFNGTDTFTFIANDGTGDSVEGTVEITINAIADVPVASPLTVSATEDTPFNGTLVGTDADGDTLTFEAGTMVAANGVVTINEDGTFSYVPDADFSGSDTFSFTVSDGVNVSDEAIVTVNVAAANDLPVVADGVIVTDEDSAVTGTLTGADADGDEIEFALGTVGPANGTISIGVDGTYIYTPNANFNGQDSFTYVANDGTGDSLEATITVNVNAVEDDPVANNLTINATEDIVFNGVLSGTDADGDDLTYALGDTSPEHGTVTVNEDGTFEYTPDADFSGEDSFTFTVNDGTSTSTEATVTIVVAAVNDLPTVDVVNITTDEDTQFSGTLTGMDADGDELEFTAGTMAAANGVVVINLDGTYTYTPNENFSGTDAFSYVANDGTGNSIEATVNVTVNAVNDDPIPVSETVTTDEDTEFDGTLTATDADEDDLVFAIGDTEPENGTVTINEDGTYTYTPDADFSGTDMFTFTVTDGNSDAVESTITVTVTAVNDVPVGDDVTFNTSLNAAVNGTLPGTDADDDELTFAAGTTAAENGTVVINEDGTFTYTPDADFSGTDTFSYIINDGTADSVEATVTINVSSEVNTAPVVTNGSAETSVDVALNGSLAPLATDGEGDTLSFVVITQPTNGTLSLSADGNFIYTPNEGFTGSDTFTFVANDGLVNSNVGTFTINVNESTDPFTLELSTTPGQIGLKKKDVVPLDPTAALTDVDPAANFSNATISAAVVAGGAKRDQLIVTDGAGGTGTIDVRGKKIRYNGVEIGRISGGKRNKPLIVQFSSSATADEVNAVLQRIGLKTSKKDASGTRTVGIQVSADGFTSSATIDANVV